MTDREKLFELLKDGQIDADHKCCEYEDCHSCPCYGGGRFCKSYFVADHLLANGVVVQKHGRWEDGKCSVCGEEEVSYSWEEPVYDYDWEENLQLCRTETHECYMPTPYCPHCGADMRGGTNE